MALRLFTVDANGNVPVSEMHRVFMYDDSAGHMEDFDDEHMQLILSEFPVVDAADGSGKAVPLDALTAHPAFQPIKSKSSQATGNIDALDDLAPSTAPLMRRD